MKGAIAAGSAPTAEAGATILRAGGNAVDAAVAACFATAVGEPTLTSLAGGGVLIHRSAADGRVTVADFFADAPRLRASEVPKLDFVGVDLDFGPTTQRFHIGAGSAAVPGVIPGLCEVLERWGSLSLADAVAPACRMLREGRELGTFQGRAAKLLEPILTFSEGARRVFAPRGAMIAAGEPFRLPELAASLEALAQGDWRAWYEGVLGAAMLAQFGPERGGLLTARDLAEYRVSYREPLGVRYRGHDVLTMPPPAAGGTMIALMLALLEGVTLAPAGSVERIRTLACAMAVADRARSEGAAALEPERLAHWQRIFQAQHGSPLLTPSKSHGSTTHVSVLDAEGNAASVTFSYGEGNGHIIGESGIVMNNLMGEEDLHPAGFGTAPPGVRLPTMMSPTLLVSPDGALTVLGSGGANRIRTAIVQVVSLLAEGHDPASATAAPRVHYEAGVLNAETFDMPEDGIALQALAPEKLVRFPERSLFFGGVHLVKRSADGKLSGSGDPRRGGVCLIV